MSAVASLQKLQNKDVDLYVLKKLLRVSREIDYEIRISCPYQRSVFRE